MTKLWIVADWVGRVGVAALFIKYGLNHLVKLPAMTGYAPTSTHVRQFPSYSHLAPSQQA